MKEEKKAAEPAAEDSTEAAKGGEAFVAVNGAVNGHAVADDEERPAKKFKGDAGHAVALDADGLENGEADGEPELDEHDDEEGDDDGEEDEEDDAEDEAQDETMEDPAEETDEVEEERGELRDEALDEPDSD